MSNIYAIGALGGSGTRAIAKILLDLGIFIGGSLNSRSDNMLFSKLFKNPSWHRSSTSEEIYSRLELFKNYMEAYDKPYKREFELRKRIDDYFKEIDNLGIKKNQLWGWKEPNTHIYLNEINEFFPQIKYIHVLRHGLDMAFSQNKQQLNNWGHLFGIEIKKEETFKELAVKQLDYWIKSTESVLKKSKEMPGRFYLLNHSMLCQSTKTEIDRLLDFIDIELKPEAKENIYKIPETPKSFHRYQNYDLTIFRQDQLEKICNFGFII